MIRCDQFFRAICLTLWLGGFSSVAVAEKPDTFFRDRVAPLLERECLRCHQGEHPKGDVNLTTAKTVVEGRGDAFLVIPGQPEHSYLLDMVSGEKPQMPPTGQALSAEEVATLERWIKDGAVWPKDRVLRADPRAWWSLTELDRPTIPTETATDPWVRNPIDAFVLARHRTLGLAPSAEADRRTLIRRLFYDLTGLPPTPERVTKFLADPDPLAYERLVEELLASPGYGERWARHWLDVVHYGDTHGFDKDKVRPHAWPYRDYVVRSLNAGKPYDQFVREQLAGDIFAPDTPDGIAALGFLAAGPFDYVGQIEVRDGTLEKRRVRNLDRDDIVATAMNTFVSLTVQCARCHDHKFDPISQTDYYRLQAVFAGVDRADRSYDQSPEIARRRHALTQRQADLREKSSSIRKEIQLAAGPKLPAIEAELASLRKPLGERHPPEHGYHSRIAPRDDTVKWVQVDLGRSIPIREIVLIGCHDDYANIGSGFGFPVRYKIEIADDPEFRRGVTVIEDRTGVDVANPGIAPQSVSVSEKTGRFVRVTATKLAPRSNDFIFALSELRVIDATGRNAAAGQSVTARDTIEAPIRWGKSNLVDGKFPESKNPNRRSRIAELDAERTRLLTEATPPETVRKLAEIKRELSETTAELRQLPPRQTVYAATTTFRPQGNFRPTDGVPRPIRLLDRGNEATPVGEPLVPGTLSCFAELPGVFHETVGQPEAARRAALAEWIVDPANPLPWRSIVNRVWHYHFGRGLAATPSDFGRMGTPPTHPELLDWLAVEFRDGSRSLKDLHRLIVTSATYRQSSSHDEAKSAIDAGNRFLWRMNRRRLEAEAVRDSILHVSGQLDDRMGGPGFRSFGFKNDHSPRYLYTEHDPLDPASHRRSIYRFVVRSVPDPFMTVLDCADPSQSVPARNETLTPLQALSLLNNDFTIAMADRFADRLTSLGDSPGEQIDAAFTLAFARAPDPAERKLLIALAEEHGLPRVCRLLFNTNEFLFVD